MLSVYLFMISVFFFFSSRRRHTRCSRDWSSDVCSSDLGTVAERAWRYTTTHRCPYVLYVWDLPPWRIGSGKPDPVWWAFGRFVRLPRLGRRYRERRGDYSRLRVIAARARAGWSSSALATASGGAPFDVPCTRVPYCYDSDRFVPPDGARSEERRVG